RVPNVPRADPVSTAIQQRLQAPAPDSVSEEIWTSVRRFYQERHDTLAWLDQAGATTKPALRVLQSAPDHGLNPAPYGVAALTEAAQTLAHSDATAPGHLERVADLDARLTAALLTCG